MDTETRAAVRQRYDSAARPRTGILWNISGASHSSRSVRPVEREQRAMSRRRRGVVDVNGRHGNAHRPHSNRPDDERAVDTSWMSALGTPVRGQPSGLPPVNYDRRPFLCVRRQLANLTGRQNEYYIEERFYNVYETPTLNRYAYIAILDHPMFFCRFYP